MRFGAFTFQIQEDDEGEAGMSAHLSSSIMPHPTSTVWCCFPFGDLSLQQFGVAFFPLVIGSALGNSRLALSMHGHVLAVPW
jgi:hypothetical protein